MRDTREFVFVRLTTLAGVALLAQACGNITVAPPVKFPIRDR